MRPSLLASALGVPKELEHGITNHNSGNAQGRAHASLPGTLDKIEELVGPDAALLHLLHTAETPVVWLRIQAIPWPSVDGNLVQSILPISCEIKLLRGYLSACMVSRKPTHETSRSDFQLQIQE